MNLLNLLNDDLLLPNVLIFQKYKPINLIDNGSFGKVYSVKNLLTKKLYAMKVESLKANNKILRTEAFFLFSLQGFGIPKFITYGHNKTYNILIEELLGKSLNSIYVKTNKKCLLSEACLIAIQLIERLEFIHSKNLIYRDVKPENFLIGKQDPNVIYVIDFGLCKKYRSSKTGKHLLPKKTGKFNGTMKYASVNALLGKEQSRRDDLIALGYMIIFFVKKKLPWNYDVKHLDREKYIKMIRDKQSDGKGSLFKNIPMEFKKYIKYNLNLKFEQEPNYEYLKSLFKNILFKMSLDFKKICFHWINKNNNQLTAYPNNKTKRKSSSHKRILENLKENSLKKIREGKSQDAVIRNNKIKENLIISPYEANSNMSTINKYNIENTINVNKIIKIKVLNNPQKKNNINEISKHSEKKKKANELKILYNINSNSAYHQTKNKIIKINKENLDKLNQTSFIFNKSRVINFNKQNILKKKNNLSVMNVNKEQLGSAKKINLSKLNLTKCSKFNDSGYIPLLTRYNNFNSEKNIKQNNMNFSNYTPLHIRNDRKIYIEEKDRKNKSNSNCRNLLHLNLNHDYTNDKNNVINNNLLYKQIKTTQNIGVMIINNYKNKGENKCKKILINTNRLLSKSNSPLQNHKNKKKIIIPNTNPFRFNNT